MKTFLLNVVFCMSGGGYTRRFVLKQNLDKKSCGIEDVRSSESTFCLFPYPAEAEKNIPRLANIGMYCFCNSTFSFTLFSLGFPFMYMKPIFLMCMMTFCYSMGNWLNVLRSLGWFPIFDIIRSISSYGGFSHQWKTGKIFAFSAYLLINSGK